MTTSWIESKKTENNIRLIKKKWKKLNHLALKVLIAGFSAECG
jgi:hypothetical protein